MKESKIKIECDLVIQSARGTFRLSDSKDKLQVDASDWTAIQHLLKSVPNRLLRFSALKRMSAYLDQQIQFTVKDKAIVTLNDGAVQSFKIIPALRILFYRFIG